MWRSQSVLITHRTGLGFPAPGIGTVPRRPPCHPPVDAAFSVPIHRRAGIDSRIVRVLLIPRIDRAFAIAECGLIHASSAWASGDGAPPE
jgi:hypothetical protein